MRIGIVSEYYRPWPGGISEHVHHEALELQRLGHEVTVVTGGDAVVGAEQASKSSDPFSVLRVGRAIGLNSNSSRGRLALGSFVWRMGALLRERAFDVLHVHAPLDPVLPLCAVLAASCPVVGTFHASFERNTTFELLYRANPIAARAWRKLAARIAVSNEAKRSIQAYFPGHYQVISNGVDLTRFRARDAELDESRERVKRVLFVGRADARKGLALLLSAHALLVSRSLRVELVLCGVAASEIAQSLALLPDAARRSVHALGYVSPAELPAQYENADVFCSPATHAESQGIVLLEAMASGCPSVCFDIAGYREVVRHEVTGLLVAEQSAHALAAALERLLVDDSLHSHMRVAALQRARDYAWPKIASELQAVLLGCRR